MAKEFEVVVAEAIVTPELMPRLQRGRPEEMGERWSDLCKRQEEGGIFLQLESSCQRHINSGTFRVRWENSTWQCGVYVGTRGDCPDSAAKTRTTAGS